MATFASEFDIKQKVMLDENPEQVGRISGIQFRNNGFCTCEVLIIGVGNLVVEEWRLSALNSEPVVKLVRGVETV